MARKRFGPEAALVSLGYNRADVTQVWLRGKWSEVESNIIDGSRARWSNLAGAFLARPGGSVKLAALKLTAAFAARDPFNLLGASCESRVRC
jgi:hypothetical protein